MKMTKLTQVTRKLLGCALVALIFIGISIPVVNAEIAVIVHSSNAIGEISVKQIRAIFLRKSNSFPNGMSVEPISQKHDASIHVDFRDKVLRKNRRQLKVYWAKRVFAGKAAPPRVIGYDTDVKKWLATNSNGIGYIDASAVDSSVKVILTLP